MSPERASQTSPGQSEPSERRPGSRHPKKLRSPERAAQGIARYQTELTYCDHWRSVIVRMRSQREESRRLRAGMLALVAGVMFIALDFKRSGNLDSGWRHYPIGAAIGGMLVAGGCFQGILRCIHSLDALELFYLFLSAWQFARVVRHTDQGVQLDQLSVIACALSVLTAICLFLAARSSKNRITA